MLGKVSFGILLCIIFGIVEMMCISSDNDEVQEAHAFSSGLLMAALIVWIMSIYKII